jgi:hypothetical protein
MALEFLFFSRFKSAHGRIMANGTDLHIMCKNLVVEKDQGSLHKKQATFFCDKLVVLIRRLFLTGKMSGIRRQCQILQIYA